LRVSFKTDSLKLFFEADLSRIKGKHPFPLEVLKQYQLKVKILNEVKGDRKNEFSIRLNKQYRLIFIETQVGIEILIVEISKHYE
jgi:toxin HigB-1